MENKNKKTQPADIAIDDIDTSPSSQEKFLEHDQLASDQELENLFKQYVLEKQDGENTVFHFAKYTKIEEADFYNYFGSLNVLEQEIWSGYFDETKARLKAEDVYLDYTVREKLLAFFFTLFELLKEDRSYIVKTAKGGTLPRWSPDFLDKFKSQYIGYINELIEEGKETGEIAERFLITKQYSQGLWLQFLFVLNFWIKDESKSFEKTDSAVEKAINFSLDIMGRSALDSFTDFAKFIYQSWKPS